MPKFTRRWRIASHCATLCHMPDTTPLLGSTEVCRRLSIDKSTLGRWVEAGRIHRAHKLPGRNGVALFTEAEVARIECERSAQIPA